MRISKVLSGSIAALLLLASPAARKAGRAFGSEPRRIAVFAGGSGEPGASGGFLVEDLRDLRLALKARGWTVTAAVGPTDRLLPGSLRATRANILKRIRGELRSARNGDEVLLTFHSHGLEREAHWGQRSHSLVSEDRDPSGAEPGFNIDVLEPDLIAARGRGVRVAVVDLSCYSGATQNLRGPECVVTLAAPHYVSVCSGRPEERTFSSRFIRLPAPGTPVSLESRFLDARGSDQDSINLPQISSRTTPAARAWDSLLSEVDPLDLNEDIKDFRTGARPFHPARLLRAVHQALKRSDLDGSARVALEREIAGRARRVVELRARIEKAMPAMARLYDQKSLVLRLPGRDPLPISPGYLEELIDKVSVKHFKPEEQDGYSDAARDLMRALRPERERILREFDGPLHVFTERLKAYNALADGLVAASGRLFASERRLYAHASTRIGSPDPCDAFSL